MKIEAAHEKEPLATWAGRVLAEWRRGLAAIARGDEEELALLLEPVLRQRVLTAFLTAEGVTWHAALKSAEVIDRLKSLTAGDGASLPRTWPGVVRRMGEEEANRAAQSLAGAGFSPEDYPRCVRLVEELYTIDVGLAGVENGAGARLDALRPERDQIAPPTAWRELMRAAPEGTRAEVRGRLIARHRDQADLRASWAGVVAGGQVYDLGNPLMTTDPPARG
jgi:hypothetical protein